MANGQRQTETSDNPFDPEERLFRLVPPKYLRYGFDVDASFSWKPKEIGLSCDRERFVPEPRDLLVAHRVEHGVAAFPVRNIPQAARHPETNIEYGWTAEYLPVKRTETAPANPAHSEIWTRRSDTGEVAKMPNALKSWFRAELVRNGLELIKAS